MAQQTSVEWLVNHWKKLQSKGAKMSWNQIIEITELANEMHKAECIAFAEQWELRCNEGNMDSKEKLYNETFNK
jgi:hypothetical protein